MPKPVTIDTTAREIRDPQDREDLVDVEAWSRGYTVESFWRKLRRQARHAGAAVVERALQLFYALQDPTMPAWAKVAVVAALGYFILPFDLVPDFIPGLGFGDDLATLTSALMTVQAYITDDVRAKARAKLRTWYPELD
jgi:uncharacterized membrane protein YkvA (DUF1232 family)